MSSVVIHIAHTVGGGSTYNRVALRGHPVAFSYSSVTTRKGDADDGGVHSVGGTDISDGSITMSIDAANDLKNKYRSVLKYVKTLPSSHNWLRYIKEKVNRCMDA